MEATTEKKRLRVARQHIQHDILTHEASIEGELDILKSVQQLLGTWDPSYQAGENCGVWGKAALQ